MIYIQTYRRVYQIPYHSDLNLTMGAYYQALNAPLGPIIRCYKGDWGAKYDYKDNSNSVLILNTDGVVLFSDKSIESEYVLRYIIQDMIEDYSNKINEHKNSIDQVKGNLIIKKAEAPMLNDSMHTVLTKWEISEGKRNMRDTKSQSLGIS